jgi:hypothetical protein
MSAEHGRVKAHRLVFAVFAVSLLALSPLAFYSKTPLVFYRFDGTFLLIAAAMQNTWGLGGWNFTTNPLEGLGGLALPQQALLDPGLWLTAHLSPVAGPVVAMTFYVAALAAAICWLGMRLGAGVLPSIAAAWIGLLLAFPYVYPTLGFDFLWGVPAYVPLIALEMAALLLLLDLGRGPRAADAARLIGIGAILAYEFIQYPNFVPLSLLVLGFFGLVAVFATASRRERMIKIACGIGFAGLALILFGRLLYGLWGFSKATFFWYEFFPRPADLRDQSFLIADHSNWPAWIVYGLSLAGAVVAAWRGPPTLRTFARGFLIFVLGELVVVLVTKGGWKGPRVAYIDIFVYPFYCLFAAYALAAAASVLKWPKLPIGMVDRREVVGGLILCALPWLVLIDYAPSPLERHLVRNLNPFIWPPAETPISEFLAAELALRPGSAFRGRVANIAGSDADPQWISAPFINQHNYDGISLFFSGNDHRMYGLWYFGIPTLIELNQFSSPFFHLVNARLLNAPGALDLRAYETQSIVNDRVMALLGVRYLISDKLLPERAPAMKHRFVEGRDLFVYSVPDTNLAGYSVTHTRRAANAQEAVSLLADPSLDLRDVAVLTTADGVPPLVRVSDSRLLVERGGYRIEATSTGTSLLVLPIEYSHCLRPEWSSMPGAPSPRLVRANLTMAAVLFTGEVKGRLVLRYDPLSSGCRIEDWREAQTLRLGEAREWPSARR